MKSIAIYCGSSDSIKPVYAEAARHMGAAVAANQLTLVYGGGSTGLMGLVADAVIENGGEVHGIITEQFNTPQLAHTRLTRMEVLPDMHSRKARMAALADGFIALPGGFGTLEELSEMLTWSQIGLHAKPIGLLNAAGFFDPLLQFFTQMQNEGFLYQEHLSLYSYAEGPDELLEKMMDYMPPGQLSRWVDRDDH